MKNPLVLADRTHSLSAIPFGAEKDVSQALNEDLLAAVERALLAGETHYTVRPGIPKLRRSIAEAVIEAGGPTPDAEDPMDNVLITSDVSEALFVVLLGLELSPGNILASLTGTCRHAELFSLMGMEISVPSEGTDVGLPIKLTYREWDSDIRAQERALTAATAHDCIDVLDLGSSLWSGSLKSFPPHQNRTVLVGNLDAVVGLPTFRVAFLVAPKDIFARCRPWKQALSICSAAPSQRAALHALEAFEQEAS